MGLPAATANHSVTAIDTHIVLVPTPGGPVPTPLPHPFQRHSQWRARHDGKNQRPARGGRRLDGAPHRRTFRLRRAQRFKNRRQIAAPYFWAALQ